jgi:ribonuclease P protein component
MRRFDALRRRSEFTRLYRHGRKLPLPQFALYALPGRRTEGRPRIGISVSKEVGRAVVRNRVRRRVQCSLDELAVGRLGDAQLLLVARPGARDVPFAEIRAQLAYGLALAQAAV